MIRLLLVATALLLAPMVTACGEDRSFGETGDVAPVEPATESGRRHSFDLERVATGLNRPLWVGAAPGDRGALWVLEQPGRVVRLDGHRREVALDMTDQVTTGTEQGLLGIAFHPDFATNRLLYLHWSDRGGDTRVAEFRATPDGRRIEPRPVRELLFVDQPEENHKGGQLAFGPDERLYLGLGDGGGAFDPRGVAQDPDSLLGKLIATDLRDDEPRWQPVVVGLRNPWRFSFDAGLGEIWIADVGQDEVEEVNRVQLELDEPPKNLGWSAYEGINPVAGHELADGGELVWPVAAYGHDEHGGCSVIGGVVYAGTRLARLSRRYVYGDFCAGTLWSLRGTPEGGATDVRRERATIPQLTHIGADADGELIFTSAAGDVYRAVARTGSPGA